MISPHAFALTCGAAFERAQREDRAALLIYLMAAERDILKARIEAAVAGGADIIELGFPFSDPLADGPTIQKAAQEALDAGVTFDGILAAMRTISPWVRVPILAFTYYNPVFVRGTAKTAADLADAGFRGAIIPDLPPEEADTVQSCFAKAGLGLSFLVSPTTPLSRIAAIAERCTDFIYVVSRMGVTGAKDAPSAQMQQLVARIRPFTNKPLAVGFGISNPEDVRAAAMVADGVVVGSAVLDRIMQAPPAAQLDALREYCRSLAAACHRKG